jgi:hypothetical protein
MNNKTYAILIIFPEGNIANNPNMLSIVLLLNDYYQIYIVHERKDQEFVGNGISICYLEKLCDNTCFENNKKYIINYFDCDSFSLIFGVDQGIKFADFLAKQNNTPLAYISYELYFLNEWNDILKKQEIDACKDIAFAICQDSMRSYLLSRENNIPLDKIINIPISETYNGSYKRSTYLHENLNIPKNKKIVLYIGSLGKWTMTEKLIESTELWPEEWVLVLHPRYGIDSYVISLLDTINNNPKVYLSTEPKTYTYELEEIICSSDLGLVLYDLYFTSPETGKNILFVGLSSGKFSVFMKYNVPVIVNNNTNIADIVSQYNLGYVLSNIGDIYSLLPRNDRALLHSNCNKFFIEYLDFNLYKNTILLLIEMVIKNESIAEIIKINNQKIDIKNINDIRMDMVYNKMKDTINSLNNYKNNLFHNKIINIIKEFMEK